MHKIPPKMHKCANIRNKCQFDTRSHHQTDIHLRNMSLSSAVKQVVFIYNDISLHPLFVPSIQTQNNIWKLENVNTHIIIMHVI